MVHAAGCSDTEPCTTQVGARGRFSRRNAIEPWYLIPAHPCPCDAVVASQSSATSLSLREDTTPIGGRRPTSEVGDSEARFATDSEASLIVSSPGGGWKVPEARADSIQFSTMGHHRGRAHVSGGKWGVSNIMHQDRARCRYRPPARAVRWARRTNVLRRAKVYPGHGRDRWGREGG